MKIAVLGAGISGLGSAYILSQKHEVDLYEKEHRLGGHARTTQVHTSSGSVGMDTGFLVFNNETYPLLTKLFEKLDVEISKSDMSFGFWDEKTNLAYNGESLGGLFFQKRNLFNLSHYAMIRDILRFNKQANEDLESISSNIDKSLGEYLASYSDAFKERYILPMGAAIWSTPSSKMHEFPARTFLQFFKNHGLLGVSTHYQWLTVTNGSVNYVNKISQNISGKIVTKSDVVSIKRTIDGVKLIHQDGHASHYDKVVLAMHAPDALKLLGEDATNQEREVLGAFEFKDNDAVLHSDTKVLYPNKKIYAAWNYKTGGKEDGVTLSYYINRLQNLDTQKEYFVSLNETQDIDEVVERIGYSHPQFDAKAIHAQKQFDTINGNKHTFFAGAYWRYGFHEDGLYSANRVAQMMGCRL